MNRAFWGRQGRIGCAQSGPHSGRYVFAYPEKRDEFWSVFVQEIDGDQDIIDYYFQGDGEMDSLVREWAVAWLPREDDEVVEEVHFGMRPLLG